MSDYKLNNNFYNCQNGQRLFYVVIRMSIFDNFEVGHIIKILHHHEHLQLHHHNYKKIICVNDLIDEHAVVLVNRSQ